MDGQQDKKDFFYILHFPQGFVQFTHHRKFKESVVQGGFFCEASDDTYHSDRDLFYI